MRLRHLIACGPALLAVAGCGGDDTSQPSEPSKPGNPAKVADAYALDRSQGTRTGCTQAPRGRGLSEPGCIYVAAYAGCYEGITGEQVGPVSYKREFPEPGLRVVYENGRRDCQP